MLAASTEEFISFFSEIDDPRQDGKVLYPLDEVLFLIFTAILSCAESWDLIVDFGNNKIDFLRKFMPFKNGIPAKSTLCTIMSGLEKTALESWFNKGFKEITSILPEDLVTIDGKSLRGTKSFNNKTVHMVHAFATKQGLVIGQKKVSDKSNEITAIPELIDELNISNTTVSIDAMGCQKKIAKKICDKNSNYFLALKENQEGLYKDVKTYFDNENYLSKANFIKKTNKSHGRLEVRECWCLPIDSYLKEEHADWESLSNIVCIRRSKTINGNTSLEKHYYISSIQNSDAEYFLKISRDHWLVENQLHWVLDVTFNEDRCTIKKAAENMAVIRKLVLNSLKLYKKKFNIKNSMKGLRLASSWSDQSRAKIILNLGMVV
tara:strand:+ start:1937 stop:3070 length:1134 start_codon:yes stop_codon:yes gene_type:complete